MKQSFVLYYNDKKKLDRLDNDEFRLLIEAMFAYDEHGIEPNFLDHSERLEITWDFFKDKLDNNKNKYDRRCETSAENGKKGGRPPKNENLKKPNNNLNNPLGYDEIIHSENLKKPNNLVGYDGGQSGNVDENSTNPQEKNLNNLKKPNKPDNVNVDDIEDNINILYARTREEWKSYLVEICLFDSHCKWAKMTYGSDIAPQAIMTTLLNFLMSGKDIEINGERFSYDFVVDAIKNITPGTFGNIAQYFYIKEEDKPSKEWRLRHLSNQNNYIIKTVINESNNFNLKGEFLK